MVSRPNFALSYDQTLMDGLHDLIAILDYMAEHECSQGKALLLRIVRDSLTDLTERFVVKSLP